MQGQIKKIHFLSEAASSSDECVLLLEEVDFKWLMAGQGWWIDTTRLHSDPSYAAGFLRLAMESQSFVVRECATFLQVLIEHPHKVHSNGFMVLD